MTVAVRPATSADAPELAELLNGIIARGGTTALQEAFTPERLDETYLTGPDVLSCVVAVDNESGRLEGFQTLIREAHLPADWGDIGTFSRFGGTQRGVGSALFAATSERARALGLAGLNATIRADNEGGLAFYGKLGFEDHDVSRAVRLNDGRPVDRISKRYKLNEGLQAAVDGEVIRLAGSAGMSIEGRVEGAITDLGALLAEDEDVDASISKIAALYELSPMVVRKRAETALGDLAIVSARAAIVRARLRRERAVKAASYAYCEKFFGVHSDDEAAAELRTWLEAELTSPPTTEELAYATSEMQLAFSRHLTRTLEDLMKNA